MNYNPVYPVFVKYNVSQDVWNMHDIYVWHFLLKSFGTKKTFRYLQYRLEHNQSMYPIVSFLCIVFLLSWLVTFSLRFSSFRRQFANQFANQNTMALLKRFILNLHPTLRYLLERRARLIRMGRERRVIRVVINQPNAAGGAGGLQSNGTGLNRGRLNGETSNGQPNGMPPNGGQSNGGGNRENPDEPRAKRRRYNSGHTQMPDLSKTLASNQNREGTESDSGDSPS